MSHHGTIRRYTLIIEKLKSNQYPSLNEIIDYLNNIGLKTSKRTTERDLDAIRNDFGIEISYNRLNDGYFIDYDNSINIESFFRFLEIVNTAELLSESLSESKEALSYISFDTGGGLKGIEYLKPLLQAIKEHRKVAFKHFNFHTELNKSYSMKPYLLKEYQNRWYIVGVVEGINELRTFGIDRLEDLKLKTDTFIPDKKINPLAKFEQIVGLVYSDAEQQRIVLSFTPNQGHYIKTLPIHKSQQILVDDATEFRIELKLIPNFELTQKILMNADAVKVVEPKWLADEIKNILLSSLENYK
jgi:proteasome accessory factor B